MAGDPTGNDRANLRRSLAALEMLGYVLEDDYRVVDDKADGDDDRREAHDIDRVAAGVEQNEGHDEREGDAAGDDEAAPRPP